MSIGIATYLSSSFYFITVNSKLCDLRNGLNGAAVHVQFFLAAAMNQGKKNSLQQQQQQLKHGPGPLDSMLIW